MSVSLNVACPQVCVPVDVIASMENAVHMFYVRKGRMNGEENPIIDSHANAQLKL